MLHVQPATIEAAFSLNPVDLGLPAGGPMDPVVIRYDGEMRGEEPVVFGVISVYDVAKLQPDLVERIFDVVSHDVGSVDQRAFVVTDGVSNFVYLDSDRFDEIFTEIFDESYCGGHPVSSAVGDLLLLTNEAGDVSVGQKSALKTVMTECNPDDAKLFISRAHSRAKSREDSLYLSGSSKLPDPGDDDDSVPSI